MMKDHTRNNLIFYQYVLQPRRKELVYTIYAV